MMTATTCIKHVMENYVFIFRKIKANFLLIHEMHVYTCAHSFTGRII